MAFSILDMTDDQVAKLVTDSMNMPMPDPAIALLRDELLELILQLQEIKRLAIKHATLGTGVPADQLLTLLDGKKETRKR